MLAKMTPQTTVKAFEKGRERIKAGRHTPDFEELKKGLGPNRNFCLINSNNKNAPDKTGDLGC